MKRKILPYIAAGVMVLAFAGVLIAGEHLASNASIKRATQFEGKDDMQAIVLLFNGEAVATTDSAYSEVLQLEHYNENDAGILLQADTTAAGLNPHLRVLLQVTPSYQAFASESELSWYTVDTIADTTDSASYNTGVVDTLKFSDPAMRWSAMRLFAYGDAFNPAGITLNAWIHFKRNDEIDGE